MRSLSLRNRGLATAALAAVALSALATLRAEEAAEEPSQPSTIRGSSGKAAAPAPQRGDSSAQLVRCANLVYANGKTSKCFSSEFLAQLAVETNVATHPRFDAVPLESAELYNFPFAVMTGEDGFTLSDAQRTSLRNYLENGGFIVASAGCSSNAWAASFRQEMAAVFPDVPLAPLDLAHPVFHTVYDIDRLDCKKSNGQAHLEGLEIDGKIVLVFSSDGLNDTGKAGGNCCCCGGNEILNSRQVNVNLLAYTLTH